MTNQIKCITLRFVKRINPFDFDDNVVELGPWGFRLPPTFSLLWTLGPQTFLTSLECPFLFLLSFLSGHSKIPPATAIFFCIKSDLKNAQNSIKINATLRPWLNWIEQQISNLWVAGSSPAGRAINK